MVETICPHCGNRKSFEDSHVGKTFRCPSCTNPVKIEYLGEQLSIEPTSLSSSLTDEIKRAEKEKKEAEHEKKAKEAKDQEDWEKSGAPIMGIICLVLWFISIGNDWSLLWNWIFGILTLVGITASWARYKKTIIILILLLIALMIYVEFKS